MKVTLYERTTSYCGMCVAMKRKLDKEGVEYETKAIEDQSSEWLEEHKSNGVMNAPITVVEYPSGGFLAVGGFRPDFVESLEVK